MVSCLPGVLRDFTLSIFTAENAENAENAEHAELKLSHYPFVCTSHLKVQGFPGEAASDARGFAGKPAPILPEA